VRRAASGGDLVGWGDAEQNNLGERKRHREVWFRFVFVFGGSGAGCGEVSEVVVVLGSFGLFIARAAAAAGAGPKGISTGARAFSGEGGSDDVCVRERAQWWLDVGELEAFSPPASRSIQCAGAGRKTSVAACASTIFLGGTSFLVRSERIVAHPSVV
jgi:hypothetical protein